jgi:hypothetical protein
MFVSLGMYVSAFAPESAGHPPKWPLITSCSCEFVYKPMFGAIAMFQASFKTVPSRWQQTPTGLILDPLLRIDVWREAAVSRMSCSWGVPPSSYIFGTLMVNILKKQPKAPPTAASCHGRWDNRRWCTSDWGTTVRPNQLTTSITMYWSFRHMKYSWDVPHLATRISFEITRRRESSPFSSNPAE